MLNRRQTLAFAGAALAFPAIGRAQSAFPARSITIVVAYPAGGPTDAIARIVGQAIEDDLKQKVVVENRAGASGSIGTRHVAQSEPDGYTITFGNNQTHGNNMLLMKAPGYDAMADFAPLAGVGAFPHALVIKNGLEAKTLLELIALAKSKPGVLNYGSTGNGSGSHLSMELLMRRTGISMQHIPYQGAAPLVQDIIGGRIDVSLSTLPSVLKQIEAGQMRGIGVASTKRAPQLASMPTFREQGISNADAESWAGFFAPAKVPAPVLDRLSKALIDALKTEAVSSKISALGFALDVRPPSEFRAYLKQEMDTWTDIVRAAGIQPT
jgi:tripartite-type tricarboxylate transporter receptor subunit TctC